MFFIFVIKNKDYVWKRNDEEVGSHATTSSRD